MKFSQVISKLRHSGIKNRNFISLTIAFAYVAISITGLFLYFGIKSEAIEIIHVLFGILFTVLVIFHIWYNFASIRNYSKNKKSNAVRKELIISFTGSMVLLLLMCFGFSFMEDLSHAGRNLFGNDKRRERNSHMEVFSTLQTNQQLRGTALTLMIWFKQDLPGSSVSVWAEDPSNNIYECLLLPAKKMLVPEMYNSVNDLEKSEIRKEIIFTDLKSDSFPELNSRRSGFQPNYQNASPFRSFLLQTKTTMPGNFCIFLEMHYNGKSELFQASIEPGSEAIVLNAVAKNDYLKKGIVLRD